METWIDIPTYGRGSTHAHGNVEASKIVDYIVATKIRDNFDLTDLMNFEDPAYEDEYEKMSQLDLINEYQKKTNNIWKNI